MLIPFDNSYHVSKSPHSVGLAHNMTIPVTWSDNNWFVVNQHRFNTMGMQGLGQISMGSPVSGCGCGCASKCKGNYKGMGDFSNFDLMDTISNMSLTDWIAIVAISLGILFFYGPGPDDRRTIKRGKK